jgi:hypothetical protein
MDQNVFTWILIQEREDLDGINVVEYPVSVIRCIGYVITVDPLYVFVVCSEWVGVALTRL